MAGIDREGPEIDGSTPYGPRRMLFISRVKRRPVVKRGRAHVLSLALRAGFVALLMPVVSLMWFGNGGATTWTTATKLETIGTVAFPTQNYVYYPFYPWSTESACWVADEWGTYDAVPYAQQENGPNNGCVGGDSQVVYVTGTGLANGPVKGTTRHTVWVPSQGPVYHSAFGAHWNEVFNTRNMGQWLALWTTNAFS